MMDTKTLASLLAAVPSADLRLIELTAELTRPDGSLDLDAAASRSAEMELAAPIRHLPQNHLLHKGL